MLGGTTPTEEAIMAMAESARSFQLVVAATKSLGIGRAGKLPWKLPGDMAYFKELTSKTRDPSKRNVVVMGRKTWEGLPAKFRPLPGRINFVLTSSAPRNENCAVAGNRSSNTQAGFRLAFLTGWAAAALKQGVHLASSLEAALEDIKARGLEKDIESVFIIGGGQVYAEALKSPHCSAVHYTEIEQDVECDTYFPRLDPAAWRVWSASRAKRENGLRYSFLCFVPASQSSPPQLPPAATSRHEEQQYLDMVADVIEEGAFREDRTGTGTFSKFGCQMRFDLRHSFPLLTTKRVFWRGVAEELLWFVRGDTNARNLRDKGIHIWDGNSSRAYLDSIGLSHREEDDLGPVYGFQWRHFGATYTDMHADYTGQGYDQLAEVVSKLRSKSSDRRIILSAWNPAALSEMALPPCHMFAQFYVADGELSCQMYQRSADLGLGVPFNIASYALLTCLLAKVCDLRPGDLIHVLGDAHVYANHVEPLKEQLRNTPRPFPVLRIKTDKRDIDSFVLEDLELLGYNPHKKIAMTMAV